MNTDREREKFLADVLGSRGDLREAALQAGLSALRRRRVRRNVARAVTLLLVPLLAAALIVHRTYQRVESEQPASIAHAEQTVPGTTIRVLTDEQLLDMFQGRPVALIGPPGDQRLLLLDHAAN
jgi:hypothetical protein